MDKENNFLIGNNVSVNGYIKGKNNTIDIQESKNKCSIKLKLVGDNNKIFIKNPQFINELEIFIGSHIPANHTSLSIEENLSCAENNRIFIYTDFNTLIIGKNCLFSNSITFRLGETPHLIFDNSTGAYLENRNNQIVLGNSVWVGEGAYFVKNSKIPNGSIVAAKSVVTRLFDEENAVYAGNPAKLAKRNIKWFQNYSYLEKDSNFLKSYEEFKNFNKN